MFELFTIKLQNSSLGTVRPTTMNSAIAVDRAAHGGDFSFWNPQEHFPILDTERFVVNGYHANDRAIENLLFGRCPSAIPRLVIAVIVNSINRMTRRGSKAHIPNKGHKAFSPTLTNSNSSSSISGIFRTFWVLASTLHITPNSMLRSLAHAMKVFTHKAISSKHFSAVFGRKTATARFGLAKVGSSRASLPPTIALTQPHGVPLLRKTNGLMQNDKPTKALAGEINKFSHNKTPSMFLRLDVPIFGI